MPTGKTRTQSKCRNWEQQRRKRLAAAFTALAAALPSPPPPTTKLLILQDSLLYIEKLKADLSHLKETQKLHATIHADATVCSDADGELPELRVSCWRLLQALLGAGLPLPPPPKWPAITIDGIAVEKKITKDGRKCVESDKENVKEMPKNSEVPANKTSPMSLEKEAIKITKKKKNTPIKNRILKKPTINRKHTRKKAQQKSNVCVPASTTMLANTTNVWLTNGNLRGPVVMGGGLVPLLSLPLPPPPPPTIFFLQRPVLKKNSVDSIVIDNFPSVAPSRKPSKKIYSNIYGFDVTRTTMVNKVPISAFSTSLSMVKEKKSSKILHHSKVTQRTRRKIFNCRVDSKTTEEKQFTTVKDSLKHVEIITSKVTTQSDSECKKIVAVNSTSDSVKADNKIPQNIIFETLSPKSAPVQVKDSNQIASSKISNVAIKSLNSSSEISQPENVIKEKVIEYTSAPVHNVNSLSNHESSNLILMESSSKNTNPNCSHEERIKSEESIILKSENSFDTVDKIPILNSATNQHSAKLFKSVVIDENSKGIMERKKKVECEDAKSTPSHTANLLSMTDSECRLSVAKGNDITEELLGGWANGGGAPLPPSPLPSSPTAAFLLAFPLVCSGPRPETPLNDNLQTPNICSMDHFSNFFMPKDSSSGINLPLINQSNNIFVDCQAKSSNDTSNDKIKSSWFLPQSSHGCAKSVASRQDDLARCGYRPSQSQSSSSISSACAYSDMKMMFPHTKPITSNNSYCLSESIFSYEHAPITNNTKDQKHKIQSDNTKTLFHYDNLPPETKSKIPSCDSNLYTSIVPTFVDNVTSVSCNNSEIVNTFGGPLFLPNNPSSCKKTQVIGSSSKLVIPGVVPEYSPSVNKSIDISNCLPFSFPTPNTSNTYTSCNTFNPFTTDMSANLGISCGSSNDNTRPKPASNSYFSDFSTNIYSQSCNLWMEESISSEHVTQKTDYNKKMNSTLPANQNIQATNNTTSNLQPEFRFPLPVTSKSSGTKHNISADVKNIKNHQTKFACKDAKFASQDKGVKSEYSSQKGPVNWMTSEVHSGQQSQDMFLPNFSKDIKNVQNMSLSNIPQYSVENNSPIVTLPASLSNKKSEIYDQPFYHVPSGNYVSQVANEENQYSWSPSKLAPSTDAVPAVSCSLPTLVGDLALGIGETKQAYQNLFLEQTETSGKERKHIMSTKVKDNFIKSHNPQNIDMNSSNTTGSFLSVSQLMDRRKEESSGMEHNGLNKSFPYPQKKHVSSDNQNRIPNMTNQVVVSANKCYDANHANAMPFFPTEVFPLQQMTDHYIPSQLKNTHFIKSEVNKNINKNTYSTESLLQVNDSQYNTNRKQKNTSNSIKSYDASNLCIPANIHGNHHGSSGYPLQYNNPQSQSNIGNSYPYPTPPGPSNPPLYSTAGFITSAANMNSANYTNSAYMTELTDFSTSADNHYFSPKLEHCRPKPQNESQQDIPKYSFNNKMTGVSKDVVGKHKIDSFKRDSLPNKRQKKAKSGYCDNYMASQDRCIGSISNTMNSSLGMDDSFFGYFSSSQMHPYPSQPPPPPSLSSNHGVAGQGNYRNAPSSAKAPSPNPSGTSLTNFNLSTIFPEINKRSSMPGFLDSQQVSVQSSKAPTLFH